jgi:hypothetical protein
MARKRGGLAGVWDRNKQIIKPVATLGAGVLTGGLGGAIVGGLMNGLDREGKGGIGFDPMRGAKGAVQGYGMGKLGAGIGARLGLGGAAKAAGAAMKGAAASPPPIGFQGVGAPLELAGDAPSNFASFWGAPAGTTGGNAMAGMGGIKSVPGVSSVTRVANAAPPPITTVARGAMGSGLSDVLPVDTSALTPWYRDGKTMLAAGNMLSGGLNAYNNAQTMRMQRQQMARQQRLEDEDRARRDGLDPARGAILAEILKRLGVGAVR